MENAGLFSIGQMAKWFHLSQSSIRYYEKSGLLTPEYVDPRHRLPVLQHPAV